MNLSLDDIIKKNKIGKPNNSRIRSINTNNGRKVSERERAKGRVTKPSQQVRPKRPSIAPDKITDARFKIIQKNRRRMSDAREKISELAKKTDARSKIKARGMLNMNKIHDRGRMSLSSSSSKKSLMEPVLRRSIKNSVNTRDPHSIIRCTINQQEQNFSRLSYSERMDIDEPLHMQDHDLNSITVVTQNEYTNYSSQDYRPNSEPLYVGNYKPVIQRHYEAPRNFTRENESKRMSQEMRARLDSPSKPPSPLPLPGHRIVVSNLQSTVTHEDIKELFEDIGPLLTSRLVRPGIAEVIYKFREDAKKAVDVYHNRQLDAQPMKCLLVHQRPTTNSGVLRSNNPPAPPKYPNSSKSMVVPDISAIHKALFMSK